MNLTIHPNFRIDTKASDHEYLFVEVHGMGTVAIKRQEDQGIVVDVYALHYTDACVASTWAHIHDLAEDPNESTSP
jgi:hypothetical protein